MVLDFTTIVALQITAIQAASSNGMLLNFSVGSVLRAYVESNALLVVALMQTILNLFAISRASTSEGVDLDSWMADFGVFRIDALSAYGNVTFSRFSSVGDVLIPIGATIEKDDGSCQYVVSLDTSIPEYDSGLVGYTVANGVSSLSLPVVALTPGIVGNAVVGAINTIAEAIPGIDQVNNPTEFVNGADTETDEALRARFIITLATLRKATKAAVKGAVVALGPTIQCEIVENEDYDGTPDEGHFYVIVDDGTGYPSSPLLDSVTTTVDDTRPLTSTFTVHAPTVVPVNVTVSITTPAPMNHDDLTLIARDAIIGFINSMKLGERLSYTALAKAIYDADPNILNVTDLITNARTSDVVVSGKQVVKAGTVAVI